MKKITALFLTCAALSANAGPNTGCGLGNEVIKNQDTVLMQVLAATTNGTSGNQTFGISSGTSGCAKPAQWASLQTHEFIAQNMDALAQDVAMGKGEALETLASLMGTADKAVFAATLQANFDKIYTSANIDAATVLHNITAVL